MSETITAHAERIYLRGFIDTASEEKIRAMVAFAVGAVHGPAPATEPAPPPRPRKRRILNPHGPQAVITGLLRRVAKEGATEQEIVEEVRRLGAIKRGDPDSKVTRLLRKNSVIYHQLENGKWVLTSVMRGG